MIGKTISHYKILEKLGEGGMGVVYKAQDLKLDRFVALKFLPAHSLLDEGAKKRFVHEAKAAATLDHPNICTIHEIGNTEQGQLFIAMAYYEGQTIKQKIRQRPLPINEVLDIAIATAQGLAKAHEKAITHRDIKSENIIATTDSGVKIMDFGLASIVGGTALTKTGATVGTIPYMSPEQARGDKVDHRTDVWSLGVVIHEMLTGQLPFKSEYQEAAVYAILNENPQPVTSLRSRVPMDLERIINKCLEKDPADRYQRVDELIVDLRKVGPQSSSQGLWPKKHPWAIWIGVSVIVLGLVGGYFLLSPKASTTNRRSIAVLPFANLSESKNDEYFSDGITEDVITHLSQIGDLRVIARTSTMGYKTSRKPVREIGRELNVATILEGSVRRVGNQVRITAQLVDAITEGHIWAETYDKEMTQIFTIQSEIALQIAAALRAKLSPAEKERLEKIPTENLTAYDYYLKGREYYYQFHMQDNENAIALFKKAIELDSNYALAYAGLGNAYAQRVQKFGYPEAWLDSSIQLSQLAISKDRSLSEGYKALGIAYFYEGRYQKALKTYQTAFELDPNYYHVVFNTGVIYGALGNLREALRWYKKALALNPKFAFTYSQVGGFYAGLDDDERAEQWYRKVLQFQPDFIYAHSGLVKLYIRQGKFEQALEQSRTILSLAPNDLTALCCAGDAALFSGQDSLALQFYGQAVQIAPMGMTAFTIRTHQIALAYLYWKAGRRAEAQRLFDQQIERHLHARDRGSESSRIPYDLAAIRAIQGNKTEAYEWLEQSIEKGWRDYRVALIDPLLENLRGDGQFKEKMADVKAKVDEMRKQLEEMEQE